MKTILQKTEQPWERRATSTEIKREPISDLNIEIDCAPGQERPYDLLPIVLKNLPVQPKDFHVTDACFGNWTFSLKKGKEKEYQRSKNTIRTRLTKMHEAKRIRYASW